MAKNSKRLQQVAEDASVTYGGCDAFPVTSYNITGLRHLIELGAHK